MISVEASAKPRPPFVQLSDLSHRKRAEHVHILARQGGGKTQTIQHMVYQHLLRKDCSIIFIEPKGEATEILRSLKIFQDEPKRLVVLDPLDEPALNFFAGLPKNLDEQSTRIITQKLIQLYSDAIEGLDADIKGAQRTALTNIIKLVLTFPNPSMRTLLDILDDKPKGTSTTTPYENSKFKTEIEQLDEWTRRFFQSQFYEGRFNVSRQSLSGKLQSMVSFFPKMFGASRMCIDIYERMETPGTLTLINTNSGALTEDASSFFGKMMIAQIFSAALQRNPRRSSKPPCYLYVDEAYQYFSDRIEDILTQTRSMGVGLILAHQFLDQLKPASLRSAVLQMPATRIAVPEDDDMSIAKMMRTTPEFIRSLRTKPSVSTEMACFVKGIGMDHAVRLTVPLLEVERAPRMTEEELARSKENNRRALADQPQPLAAEDTSGEIDIGDAD